MIKKFNNSGCGQEKRKFNQKDRELISEIAKRPLWKKTIQNYSENHYLKLLTTIVTIHQC